jgi:hypothetical protein
MTICDQSEIPLGNPFKAEENPHHDMQDIHFESFDDSTHQSLKNLNAHVN